MHINKINLNCLSQPRVIIIRLFIIRSVKGKLGGFFFPKKYCIMPVIFKQNLCNLLLIHTQMYNLMILFWGLKGVICDNQLIRPKDKQILLCTQLSAS